MSSSFFDTSKYLKNEKNNSPFKLGEDTSIFNIDNIYKNSSEKDNEVEKGDGKGFLDKQLGNYKSYLDATKDDKSESDKDRDLIRDLANKQEMKFGDMTKGFSSEVAQGLNIYQPPSPNQQMFIPGQQGGKSFGQRLAGAAVGLGQGLMTGVPHGGAFGAVSGFFG